jgi:hypothetical protein
MPRTAPSFAANLGSMSGDCKVKHIYYLLATAGNNTC